MCGIKIPLQDFVLKMQGGLMREGGIFGGQYGIYTIASLMERRVSFPL